MHLKWQRTTVLVGLKGEIPTYLCEIPVTKDAVFEVKGGGTRHDERHNRDKELHNGVQFSVDSYCLLVCFFV
jgi:hypothetical protein